MQRAGLALAFIVIAIVAGCDVNGSENAEPPAPLGPPRLVRTWVPAVATGEAQVNALASDGKRVFVGGDFDFLGPPTGKFALFSARPGKALPTTAAVAGPGVVDTIVPDGAGGWFLGGTFTSVAGVRCPRLAHIRANQRLDRRFCLGPNQAVRALARRGSVLYVGGEFTLIGRSRRLRLAAVDTRTGTLRAWNPGVRGKPVQDFSSVIVPSVYAIVTSPARIYIGGEFEGAGGAARENVAALDPRTGSALSWDVELRGAPDGPSEYVFHGVRTLALLDDVVYIGGSFDLVSGRSRPGIAALEAGTGELTPWSPSPLGEAVSALVATRSAVYAASVSSASDDPSAGVSVLDRRTGRRISHIRPRAADDVAWVDSLAIAGSTLFVGGGFDRFGGLPRGSVAAIDLRTHRVSDWPPAAGGPVSALATADGTLAVGGEFDTARAAARRDLAALDPESGRPVPLRMDVDGEFAAVEALAVGDSTLFVGGYFAAVQGVDRRDLAAIDLDEGRVADWSPRIQGYAYGNGLLAVHDGVVYVAPPPEDYEPPLRAIDTGSAEVLPWRPVPEDYGEPVGAMAAKGSRVYLAGDFRSIDGINRRTLAAVDAESGEVLEWDPRPNGEEGAVALAISDGTLYVGGDFTEIAGTRRFGAAAFDVESGELLDWAPNLRGGIPYAIATDESAVFFGGDFKSVGGQPRAGLAAVDPVAGRPLPWRVRVELGDFEAVRDLVVADSTLYFAGDFEQVNGVPQTGLAAVRLR